MSTTAPRTPAEQAKSRRQLFLVLAVCAAPLIASYSLYYLWKPDGAKTNYGTLLPVMQLYDKPAGTAPIKRLDGDATTLASLKGQWLMVTPDAAACDDACATKLYKMRQVREIQNKNKDRITNVLLVTDDAPVETILIRAYDQTLMLRAKDHPLLEALPADAGTKSSDHIYVIDHYGNLMMRFPKEADPNLMKKDWAKLLNASKTRS